MTAINAALSPCGTRAFVLTDSASSLPILNVFVRHVAKVRTIPHATAIVAGRGRLKDIVKAGNILQHFATLDEMTDALPQRFPSAFRVRIRRGLAKLFSWIRLRRAPRLGGPQAVTLFAMEITLVGWSDREGRMKLGAASTETEPPFEIRWAECFCGPSLTAEDEEDAYFPSADQYKAKPQSLPDALLRAMHSQRATAQGRGGEFIGGAAVLTEIRREGISQRVVHRWPDKVGERIAP